MTHQCTSSPIRLDLNESVHNPLASTSQVDANILSYPLNLTQQIGNLGDKCKPGNCYIKGQKEHLFRGQDEHVEAEKPYYEKIILPYKV